MKKYFNQKAFTLMEVMIVLAIISILVLLMVPNAANIIKSANKTGCEAITSSNEALTIAEELTGVSGEISNEDMERVCKDQ